MSEGANHFVEKVAKAMPRAMLLTTLVKKTKKNNDNHPTWGTACPVTPLLGNEPGH